MLRGSLFLPSTKSKIKTHTDHQARPWRTTRNATQTQEEPEGNQLLMMDECGLEGITKKLTSLLLWSREDSQRIEYTRPDHTYLYGKK